MSVSIEDQIKACVTIEEFTTLENKVFQLQNRIDGLKNDLANDQTHRDQMLDQRFADLERKYLDGYLNLKRMINEKMEKVAPVAKRDLSRLCKLSERWKNDYKQMYSQLNISEETMACAMTLRECAGELQAEIQAFDDN